MPKTFIIAEAGVNHNGRVALAEEMIEIALAAGADAIKFQTFRASKVISRIAPKAQYQLRTTDASESQVEMVRKLELSAEDHIRLNAYCRNKGIQFLSSPFDLDSLEFLVNRLAVPRLKIASGEITNAPLLLAAATSGKPVILSTGMSTLGDIEAALGVLAYGYGTRKQSPSINAFRQAYQSGAGREALERNVVLLHCTTEYPAPFSDVNLFAIDTIHQAFGLPVGFSDHTDGISAGLAAVARGAVILEKHFTMDRTMTGPDHKASLDPTGLKELVRCVREVELSLGSPLKMPAKSEMKNIAIARKSLVARRDIKFGEAYTEQNLDVKRPGSGISPFFYWERLGQTATQDIQEDELIR